MSDLARAPILALRAQQVMAVLYVAASVLIDDLGVISLWTAVLSVLSVFALHFQARLLPPLLSKTPVEDFDERLTRYRTLALWGLGGATVQFGLFVLLWLAGTLGPQDSGFNPGTLAMMLVAWGASLFASFRTLVTFVSAAQQPGELAVRAELREWLFRAALAGGLFTVLNVAEAVRADPALNLAWPNAAPLALYACVAALDMLAQLLIRRALAKLA